MSDSLVTYVNDHLGGAEIAIQLLEAMRAYHDEKRFRDFARELTPAIKADDETLHSIAHKIGPGPSTFKQAGGWIVEKLARLKLGHTGDADFEMFESLELLALGIQGKLSLWRALQVASTRDSRLQAFDYDQLITRAQNQFDSVERQRLDLARTVLSRVP